MHQKVPVAETLADHNSPYTRPATRPVRQTVVHTLLPACPCRAATQNETLLWNHSSHVEEQGRWLAGRSASVATQRFIAEIVSLTQERALIRYLSTPFGTGRLTSIWNATASDLTSISRNKSRA